MGSFSDMKKKYGIGQTDATITAPKGTSGGAAQPPSGSFAAMKAKYGIGTASAAGKDSAASPAKGEAAAPASQMGMPTVKPTTYTYDQIVKGLESSIGAVETRASSFNSLLTGYGATADNIKDTLVNKHGGKFQADGSLMFRNQASLDAYNQDIQKVSSGYSAYDTAWKEYQKWSDLYKNFDYDTESKRIDAELKEAERLRRQALVHAEYEPSKANQNKAAEAQAKVDQLKAQKAQLAEAAQARDWNQKNQSYLDLDSRDDFKTYASIGAAMQNKPSENAGFSFGGTAPIGEAPADAKSPEYNEVHYLRSQGVKEYAAMKEEEVTRYDYLLAKDRENSFGKPESERTNEADEYLKFLLPTLRQRVGTADAKDLQQASWAKKAGYVADAGLKNFIVGVGQNFIDAPVPTLAESIGAHKLQENARTPLEKYTLAAVGTVAQMAPSIAAGYLAGPVTGRLVMGASVAGNAYKSGIEEHGMSPLAARAYSGLVAAAEVGLQSIIGGIPGLGSVADDVLLGKVRMLDNRLLRMAATGAIHAGSEIFEEEAQLFIEPGIRMLFTGQGYEGPGWQEIIDTGIVTLISTTAMSVPDIAISGFDTKTQKLGKKVGKSGMTQLLITEALKLDPATKAHKLAAEIQAGNARVNNQNIGELYGAFIGGADGDAVARLCDAAKKEIQRMEASQQSVDEAQSAKNAASETETAAEDDVPGLAAPEVEEDGDADADPADAIPDEDVALPIVPTSDPKVQREWNRAAKIAHNFGCQLQVGKPDGGGEGSYLNGVITIDPNCKNPVMQVLLHELTHRMENSKLYPRFADTVKRYMTMDMGVDIGAVKEQIRKKHLEQGKQLTPEGMERELVAYFTQEHLFQNEKYVQRLLREDRGLFEAILDWLQDAVAWVTGKEKQDILRAQRMFEKALRTTDPKMGMDEAQWFATGSDSETSSIKEQMADSQELLNSRDVVASVTVPTNLPNKDAAAQWAADLLRATGYKVDRQGYGEIFFSKKDLDKGLRYADTAEEKAALAVLPQVLKKGIVIGEHGQHKGRTKQTITFAAPVELNGIRGNMAVVVNRHGNHYYAHRIVLPDGTAFRFADIKKDATQELSRGVTVSGSLADTTSVTSTDSIRKNAGGVNKEKSATYPNRYASMEDAPADEVRLLPTAEEIENGAQNSFGLSFDEMAQESRNAAEPGMEKWERDAAKEAKAPLDELMRLYENAAGFTSEEESWSGSPDEERMREVEAMISAGTETERKGLRENMSESWSYFKRKMVDAGDSVTQFAKAVKDDYLYPFYNMARSSASAAVNMITGEQTDIMGRRVGESLNGILDPIRKKGEEYYNQFQLYMFDLHNIDRMSIGEKATVDRVEAEQALAEFDRKYPGVAQLTEDRLRRNAENRLDLEGSALAKERLKLLRKVNRADRMRNKPVFDWDITAQKSKARAEQLLREHPEFAEYQQKIRKYIRNLMQYRVDSGLITAEDAAFLERYYPNYVPTYRRTVKLPGTRDRRSAHVGKTVGIAEGGTEKLQPLHEALGKQTMQVVREGSKNRFGARLLADYLNDPKNERAGKYVLGAQEYESEFGLENVDREETEWKKENTFTVYENGKQFEIQMDPSMFDAIKALYPSALENNAVVKVIRAGNNLFKALVTGYNPTFTVRNTVRDLQTAGLHSRNAAAFAQNYPLALREIAGNGNYWKRYQALGGSFSSVFDYQTGTVKEPKSKLGKLAAKMEALNMAMEQAPRLAEFMSVVKTGDGSMENMMDAMHAAADVTVNFGRAGTLGKVLNANFVPFLNPGIQGFDKLVRRVAQNKGAKEWAKLAVRATVLGVAPSLLNALLYDDDEDWEDLKDSDKDTNYLFKIGDGLWLKIPKGRELSILGMTADRITDMVDGEEVDWSDFIATVGNQVAPANPLEQNILKAWFDTDLFDASSPGQTWYGGDIESRLLHNYAPGERYDSSVDIFSRWIGKQLNLSPKKINYLLDQYSGVLGDFVLPLLTPQAERDPFTKAFTVDSVSSNRISNEFYDMSDELMYTKNSGNATAKVVDRFWNKQEDACTELYADIRAIEEDPDLSDKEKKQQVRETRAVLNGIQKNALAVLPTYQKAVRKHLTGSSDEEIDRAYLEANRECFGAEYAIKTYNKDVYAKATEAKGSGISFNTYYEYYFAKKGLRKKAEVMAVIKKLDIPWEQKDALYLLEGYSEKTIDETPWYMERWTLPAP